MLVHNIVNFFIQLLHKVFGFLFLSRWIVIDGAASFDPLDHLSIDIIRLFVIKK